MGLHLQHLDIGFDMVTEIDHLRVSTRDLRHQLMEIGTVSEEIKIICSIKADSLLFSSTQLISLTEERRFLANDENQIEKIFPIVTKGEGTQKIGLTETRVRIEEPPFFPSTKAF